MKKIVCLLFLFASFHSACAVKNYPREVTAREKADVNVAYVVDTAGARLLSNIYAGPGYDMDRQMVHIDYDYYLSPELRKNPRSFYPSPSGLPQVEFVE